MNKQKLYIITGISGSGKTTIARALNACDEIAFDSKINTGLYSFVDQFGEVATKQYLLDKDWRQQYKWSLDRRVLSDLMRKHSKLKRLFLCGRANIYQYWDLADKVFLLNIGAKTLLKRLNSESRDNLFARDKAAQQELVRNLETIQAGLIKRGAVIIDAEQEIDKIVSQIIANVQR